MSNSSEEAVLKLIEEQANYIKILAKNQKTLHGVMEFENKELVENLERLTQKIADMENILKNDRDNQRLFRKEILKRMEVKENQ